MAVLGGLIILLSMLVGLGAWIGLFKPALFEDKKTGKIPSRLSIFIKGNIGAVILLLIGGMMMPETKQIQSDEQLKEISSKAEEAAASKTVHIPTKKYPDVKAMFDGNNNYPSDNGSFKLLKKTPPEFLLSPEIGAQDTQDGILSDYKYAALEGLLLTFAQTDAEEITFHVLPRIWKNEKPISEASRQAVKLKITLHAKREDVAAALHKIQIYDLDDLIDHGENPHAIAGESASIHYNNLRKSDMESWKLINAFRVDKHKDF